MLLQYKQTIPLGTELQILLSSGPAEGLLAYWCWKSCVLHSFNKSFLHFVKQSLCNWFMILQSRQLADSFSLSFNGEKPGLKKISVAVSNVLIRYRLSMSSFLLFGLKHVFKKKCQRKQSGKNLLSEAGCNLVLV